MPDLALSPALATAIFVIACWAGFQYRRVWKVEGPAWKLWLYGLTAGACLLTVGFFPLSPGG
ncbi:MAG: hypothetical protein AAGD13_11080 [Pseudomonadota bacterium]